MFLNLKEKIISVGRNVKIFSESKPFIQSNYPNVNLNAGAQILNHFQQQWEEIHKLNEENAKNSDNLANVIEDMYKKVSNDHRSVTDISYLLSNGTQSLSESVENCATQLENLHDTFEVVEKNLLQLENLIETLELQERELEHRFQLALYKEKKLGNLENLRVDLAEKHTQSVMAHEKRQKQMLQERQKAFQDAFQTDLQLYKEAGSLPSKSLRKKICISVNSLPWYLHTKCTPFLCRPKFIVFKFMQLVIKQIYPVFFYVFLVSFT